jgi:hypothetical protein
LIGVDSGQVSFVDAPKYQIPDKDTWYDMVCEITLSRKECFAGAFDGGVASGTYFGDGGYPAEVVKNIAGAIVAAKVRFT